MAAPFCVIVPEASSVSICLLFAETDALVEKAKSQMDTDAEIINVMDDLSSAVRTYVSKAEEAGDADAASDRVQDAYETSSRDSVCEFVSASSSENSSSDNWSIFSVSEAARIENKPEIPSMICAKCGAQMKSGVKFCTKCGTAVNVVIPTAETNSSVPACGFLFFCSFVCSLYFL